MNESHKQYCACRECLNSEWMHEAMMKNCDKRLATLETLMNFVVTQNTNPQAIQHHTRNYNDYHDFAYDDTGKQNWATINDMYLSMTCMPVGNETWMVPYECALGMCKNCPPLPTVKWEDTRTGTGSVAMVTYQNN